MCRDTRPNVIKLCNNHTLVSTYTLLPAVNCRTVVIKKTNVETFAPRYFPVGVTNVDLTYHSNEFCERWKAGTSSTCIV